MKVLITGGAGFIGSNFIYYLMNEYPKYEIHCVDKLTYAGNIENLRNALISDRFWFYKADIKNKKDMETIFSKIKPDIVVNFAAESHVDRSIKNPSLFLKTNIIGTQVLLDLSLKFFVKRFHQISTDEVYGSLPLDRRDLFFKEDNTLCSSSPYSASKSGADLLTLAYHKTYGLPITISRCSNNYGPYQFPEKLIPLMIINALTDKELPIYGDGLNIRDWLYVRDHCKAIDRIIHKGQVGEIYNVGGHNEKNNLEVVNAIIARLGKGTKKFVKDRPGHDRRYAIDPSKITNDLGWIPETKFDLGIENTIEWYIENREWWERILDRKYMYFNNQIPLFYKDK